MESTCYAFPTEPDHAGNPYREAYLAGVERLVSERLREAAESRKEFFKDYFERPEEYRREFINMLGWPLTERKGGQLPRRVVSTPVMEFQGIEVTRLQMEIFPGVPFYGLLFRNGAERRPLVISQHGGGGTPELCSALLERGTVNYNDMTGRILRRGAHVFAPQMMIWDPAQFQSNPREGETIAQTRRKLDQSLKMAGGSITALEIACLMGALDHLEGLPYVDEDRIGMAGLSYGGFYTQYAAAADTRIKAALSSCYFNRHDYPIGTDCGFYREALEFMNSEIAMLVYPRKLSIQIAAGDTILPVEGGEEEYRRLKEYAGETERDWLRFTVFQGEHEFWKDDSQLDQFFRDLEA